MRTFWASLLATAGVFDCFSAIRHIVKGEIGYGLLLCAVAGVMVGASTMIWKAR